MAIHLLDWNDPPPPEARQGAVAIGNFDGVHRGHLGLLAELRERARALTGPAVALTFDPHPLQLLRPETFQPVLTTLEDRAALLQSNGADHVLILRTTQPFLLLSAEEFFEQVVCTRLGARALVEGVNFGFGRNREGDINRLQFLCQQAGLDLAIVQPLRTADGVVVSSSRVRDVLVKGEVGQATGLLGRPFRVRGRVGTGQRRGHTIGFATANLEGVATLLPGDGVYAVRVLHDGTTWPAAANLGPNPTFAEQMRKVEVHLIGFQGDLYGQILTVDFIDRLRDTRLFASVAQLIDQLRQDVAQALGILNAAR